MTLPVSDGVGLSEHVSARVRLIYEPGLVSSVISWHSSGQFVSSCLFGLNPE